MPAFETLQILIEADRSGLESQLKRAGSTMVQFVSSMNKQEVNWQQILTRSISPAIISGVAAMFALALEQSISFQSALQQTAATTAGFGSSMGQLSDDAIELARASTVSVGNAVTALGLLKRTTFDAATQTLVAQKATELSKLTGVDYIEVVKQMISVLQSWGISALPDATKALDDLWRSSQTGQFSFMELADQMVKLGPAMSSVTSIAELSSQLEVMSMQSGVTKETVVKSFEDIASAVDGSNAVLQSLLGGLPKIKDAIDREGVLGVLDDIAAKIRTGPTIATQALAAAMGLTAQQVDQLAKTTSDDFTKMQASASNLLKTSNDIDASYQKSMTPLDRLKVEWNKFMTDLAQSKGLTELFTLATALITLLDKIVSLKGSIGIGAPIGIGSLGSGSLIEKGASFLSNLFGGKSSSTQQGAEQNQTQSQQFINNLMMQSQTPQPITINIMTSDPMGAGRSVLSELQRLHYTS